MRNNVLRVIFVSVLFFALSYVTKVYAGCWQTSINRSTDMLATRPCVSACYNMGYHSPPTTIIDINDGSVHEAYDLSVGRWCSDDDVWWHTFNCNSTCSGGTTDPGSEPSVPTVNKPPICYITNGPTIALPGVEYDLTAYSHDPNTGSKGYVNKWVWYSQPTGGTFLPKERSDPDHQFVPPPYILEDKTLITKWKPAAAATGDVKLELRVWDASGQMNDDACYWTVRMDAGFIVTIRAWKRESTAIACTNANGDVNRITDGADFTIYKPKATGGWEKIKEDKTDASGVVTFGVPRSVSKVQICGKYTPTAACASYAVSCRTAPSGCYELDTSAFSAGGNPTPQYVAFLESTVNPWVAAIDGNVHVNNVGINLACDAAAEISGNFTSALINFSNNAGTSKAYIFSKDGANLGTAKKFIEAQNTRGGWAVDLDTPTDYLDEISIKTPSGAKTITSLTGPDPYTGTTVWARVYKISADDFNALTNVAVASAFIVDEVTDEASTPVALVYIESSPTVTNVKIQKRIIGAGTQDVILITDLPVSIWGTLGTLSGIPTNLYPGYVIAASADISTPIISSKEITVNRNAALLPGASDRSVMLAGPLVSLDRLHFLRDAGGLNDEYPIQSVRMLPDSEYIFRLTDLERKSNLDSATGFGIFDVQWTYPF